jgi:hypothetical protein
MFLLAYQILEKEDDKVDAFLLLLEAYRNGEKWDKIKESAINVLDPNSPKLPLTNSIEREILLRKAEAEIMLGALDEGRQTVRNEITKMRRGKKRENRMLLKVYNLFFCS